MKADKRNVKSGCVAIFWVDTESTSNTVYAIKSPLSQSEQYNGYLVHKSCHYSEWASIQVLNPQWQDKGLMYEDFCRGRCVYHLKMKCFYIYVCPLVKDNIKAQNNILKELYLQKSKYRFLYDDEHYILPTF